MANILIVDDHPIVREGLARIISQDRRLNHKVIGKVDNYDDALSIIKKLSPEIIIIDVFLKGADGIELIKRLKQQDENLHILVLSLHDEQLYAERAINAGANGYIMKSETGQEILKAIATIAGGGIYLSVNMTRNMKSK